MHGEDHDALNANHEHKTNRNTKIIAGIIVLVLIIIILIIKVFK